MMKQLILTSRKAIISILSLLLCVCGYAQYEPSFSTAGFYQTENSGRTVYSMNVAWRFFKGAVKGAEAVSFDDSKWEVVSTPHGLEYLPTEASGCINYQGEAWYRKHFTPDASLKGKKLFLHFEAIMGKSRIYINGQLVKEQFGGFLPVIIDVTNLLSFDKENVVAVWVDNSDDPAYPPGKAQDVLDFTYSGGIYRDCWLIAHNPVYITDPNYVGEVAGGGLFISYDKVSDQSALVTLKLQLKNETVVPFSGKVAFILKDRTGKKVISSNRNCSVAQGKTTTLTTLISVKNPELWSPESPYLYQMEVAVIGKGNKVVDGYMQRMGIRSIEFKGLDGFWLNGKPYPHPLIGANRHQDFALLGNALPNSLHWRDAKKLRDAGMTIIRNAHYPQDPSFMDACDELGLFVIVNTPGWQFWNSAPSFEQRVYADIRNMVRRDRNHPSVFLWEPILNETHYPADFAKNTKNIVEEEYPYPYCHCACDEMARGSESYMIHFCHPNSGSDASGKPKDPNRCYFTREFGDCVDDWNSHNSPSRVSRAWGEAPMLVQATHYANPSYRYTCIDNLYRQSRQHFGGALWHSFDHQRGYHPDPFYGGIMDGFRQPKYSYYMFMAQRPAVKSDLIAETGPMVSIAHDMDPFSDKDVQVYSNCEEVRLTYFKGGKQFVHKREKTEQGMPSPIITFENVYSFMDVKASRNQANVYLLAEGVIKGQVVATDTVYPARRPSKLVLWLDNEQTTLRADGSDCVVVVAGIADRNGNIKRLNNYQVRFTVTGEGRLLGDESVGANPREVVWGTAPALIQSTLTSGKIKVVAEVAHKGSQMPMSATLEFESLPAVHPSIFSVKEASLIGNQKNVRQSSALSSDDKDREIEQLRQQVNELKLKEVERQQEDFGEKRK